MEGDQRTRWGPRRRRSPWPPAWLMAVGVTTVVLRVLLAEREWLLAGLLCGFLAPFAGVGPWRGRRPKGGGSEDMRALRHETEWRGVQNACASISLSPVHCGIESVRNRRQSS